MSWVTDKAKITTILTGVTYGYRELEGNLDLESELPSSLVDKGFTLKPVDGDTRALTDLQTLVAVIAELKCIYAVPTNTAFDTAYDSWITILNAIKAVHSGFEVAPSFERHPQNNKYAIGTVRLFIGVQSC